MATAISSVTTDAPQEISEDDLKDVKATATKALKLLKADREDDTRGLLKIKDYLEGRHPGPYIPTGADQEYKILASRAINNWMPTALKAPAQALYVEGHHLPDDTDASPAWACWQRNRLDGRQTGLYRDALAYGESFVWVQKADPATDPRLAKFGKATMWTRLTTVGLYEDVANDARPAFVLHVNKWAADKVVGEAIAVDRENVYMLEFDGEDVVGSITSTAHGLSDCPVVSFVPFRDLEGTPQSILVPLFGIQDRINQTTFDRMIIQQFGAHQVRFITGMTPPPQRQILPITVAMALADGTIDADDPRYRELDPNTVIGNKFETMLDPTTGEPVPQPIVASASRMMVLADADAKVGSLPGTPLNGYLESASDDKHDFAAQSQLPPYWLGVDLANLSADALAVAASAMASAIAEYQHSFGESWEQVMQLFAEAEGLNGAEDYDSSVDWRDMSARSMGQVVDALGKAVTQLGVPKQATWGMMPGVTADQTTGWKKLAEEEAVQTANANDQLGGLAANTSTANSRYLQALRGGGTPAKVSNQSAAAEARPSAVA